MSGHEDKQVGAMEIRAGVASWRSTSRHVNIDPIYQASGSDTHYIGTGDGGGWADLSLTEAQVRVAGPALMAIIAEWDKQDAERKKQETGIVMKALGMTEEDMITNARLPLIVTVAAENKFQDFDPTTRLHPLGGDGDGNFILTVVRGSKRMASEPMEDRYLVDKMTWYGAEGVWSFLNRIRDELRELH